MNVHRLERMTHAAISKLDPQRTAVLCTMSPLEVHGPHLPLGQDMFEAQAVLERTVDAVAGRRPEWSFVIMPPLPVATDCVPALGSVSYPARLVRDVAFHALEPFAERGFARLAFSSFHGGPRHICALEDACQRIAARYDSAAVSLFSAVLARVPEDVFFEPLAGMKGVSIEREQIPDDRHAGMVETSMALHLWPELVDPGWSELPPSVSAGAQQRGRAEGSFLFSGHGAGNALERAQRGLRTAGLIYKALKHFSRSTYFGYPAFASAAQGKRMLDHLVHFSVDAFEQFLDQGKQFDGHSPLWRLKDLLLNPAVGHAAEDWLHM